MPKPEEQHVDVVASAAVTALLAARWQCADLLSRKSPEAARELMLGHAAELASSAVARDQLLSKALVAAAADLAAGRPALDSGASYFFREGSPCPTARQIVREQVFRCEGVASDRAHDVVADLERRLKSDLAPNQPLYDRLVSEARIQELLWDDPRIAADARTRLIMLCAVPKAIARAHELDPSHARFIRRREAPGRRRSRALVLVPPRGGRRAHLRGAWRLFRTRIAGWIWPLGLLIATTAGWILLDA